MKNFKRIRKKYEKFIWAFLSAYLIVFISMQSLKINITKHIILLIRFHLNIPCQLYKSLNCYVASMLLQKIQISRFDLYNIFFQKCSLFIYLL